MRRVARSDRSRLPSRGVMMPAARGIRTQATDGREVQNLAPRGFSDVLKAPVLTPLRLKVVRAHASRAMLTDVKAPLGDHGSATPILENPGVWGQERRQFPLRFLRPRRSRPCSPKYLVDLFLELRAQGVLRNSAYVEGGPGRYGPGPPMGGGVALSGSWCYRSRRRFCPPLARSANRNRPGARSASAPHRRRCCGPGCWV